MATTVERRRTSLANEPAFKADCGYQVCGVLTP